jgi:lipid II:glycine glycyltransferase (peptidoglycan interpeptide bridge formation enzyme)
MALREILDKNEWEKLHGARTIASGHFLQSWAWGEFQRSVGRKVLRFADENCVAQIVELPLPFGKKYWFCPKGPMTDNGQCPPEADQPRVETMDNSFLKELVKKAKERGVAFLRIEPQYISGFKSGPAGPDLKQTKNIDPSCTAIVDLNETEDALLAAMHPKTRYNIRVAEKHRVTVREQSAGNGDAFGGIWDLFEETAKRDGFRTHERAYYEKQILMPETRLFRAEYEGRILAAAIVFFDGDTATYLHGASSSGSRNVMAPYALHWEIMKYAKARGCARYDLWGISDDPKSGWAGITRFKRGWGGADLCAPGTYDLPVNDLWYSVYRLARRLRS